MHAFVHTCVMAMYSRPVISCKYRKCNILCILPRILSEKLTGYTDVNVSYV